MLNPNIDFILNYYLFFFAIFEKKIFKLHRINSEFLISELWWFAFLHTRLVLIYIGRTQHVYKFFCNNNPIWSFISMLDVFLIILVTKTNCLIIRHQFQTCLCAKGFFEHLNPKVNLSKSELSESNQSKYQSMKRATSGPRFGERCTKAYICWVKNQLKLIKLCACAFFSLILRLLLF